MIGSSIRTSLGVGAALVWLAMVPSVASGQVRDERPVAAAGTATLTGVVVSDDESARPIGQAIVTVTGVNPGYSRLVSTDAQGRFIFAGLPEGAATVRAEKVAYLSTFVGSDRPGRGPASPIDLRSGANPPLTIPLTHGAVLAGTITGATGRPSIGLDVTIKSWQRIDGQRVLAPVTSVEARTDDHGRFRVWGLAPGSYVVSCRPHDTEGFRLSGTSSPSPSADPLARYVEVFYPGVTEPELAVSTTLAAGEERDGLDFAMHYVTVASIEGTVIDTDGSPKADVQLTLSDGSGVTTSDGRGRFRFDAVVPGHRTVLARKGVHDALGRAEVDLGEAGIRDLVIALEPPSEVRGRVIFEGATQHPTAAVVQLVVPMAGPHLPDAVTEVHMSDAQPDGRFAISQVPAGRYHVQGAAPGATWVIKSATLNGQDVLEGTIDVRAGQNIDNLTIVFSDRATDLSGVLTDAAGKAASGYVVIVFPVDRSGWLPDSRRIVSADIETGGRYDIPGLPAGDYLLAAVRALDANDLFDPAWLEAIAKAALPITLNEGEHKKQDLKLGGG